MPLSNIFFNTQHAPTGAHASLTLGFPGARGGMDLELCRAPNQSILVAVESRTRPNHFDALPFTDVPDPAERKKFVNEELTSHLGEIHPVALTEVSRDFQLATDTWRAGDLRFTLFTPVRSIPDLDRLQPRDELAAKRALVPAVRGEIEVDNRGCTRVRRVVVGFSRVDPVRGLRHLKHGADVIGVGDGLDMGVFTEEPGACSSIGFDPLSSLTDPKPEHNRQAMLGPWGSLVFEVQPGEVRTLRVAYAFYRPGVVTSGLSTRYYYTRWFDSLEAVGAYALADFDEAIAASRRADAKLQAHALSEAQHFTVAHTTRSYLYSTQMLVHEGAPLWVVNEGEFNMINTLDLAGDHSLYESRLHPWVIRNILEQYARRYTYEDTLHFADTGLTTPGGISFVHDMGVNSHFAPPGHSAYELAGLTGCFSYMSTEELLNWVLCAGVYVHASGDLAWARGRADMLERCLLSLELRDHPDDAQRCGVPRADSSRCAGGREITTYDCLDPSLGQASGNTYIAGKAWAAGLILHRLFTQLDRPTLAARAHRLAQRAAKTVCASAREDGRIPALLQGGGDAVILPVVEGLAYPWFAGCRDAMALNGEYGAYLTVLKRHMADHVLRDDTCIYPDGGWRITSSNSNTFPAKVYVCQFVAREILGMSLGAVGARADEAHAQWQLHPEHSAHCWTEQVDNGIAHTAKYYPRGVSSNIWLTEQRPQD
jgi:xylan 1,4-beta-xylosidase